jgi:hypothetical protein
MSQESESTNSITNIFKFVKDSGSMMTAILLNPKYDEKKGRVSKGEAIAHFQWNKSKWIDKNVRSTPRTGALPTAWFIALKKLGFYVIDIDPKDGRDAKDVMKKEIYDWLMDKSSYVIQTGSKGLHFYFQYGELEDGDDVRKSIDVSNLDWFYSKDLGSVDIITDNIISEKTYYDYDGTRYEYQCIKGDITKVNYSNDIWELVKPIIIRNPEKEKEELLEKRRLEKEQRSLESNRRLQEEKEYAYTTITLDEIKMHLANIVANDGENYNYKKWYEMGQTIKNIYPDIDEGYILFDSFSQHCRAYDPKAVLNLWKGLKVRENGKNRTIGSILYLSKVACEDEYYEIRKKFQPLNYRMIFEQFEANHFYFSTTNTVAEVDKYGQIVTYSKEHAFDYLNTWKYHKKDETEHGFIRQWWEDSNRKMIRKLVSKTIDQCEKDEYPIFSHFHFETLEVVPTDEQVTKAIESFVDLLRCVCNDEEKVSQYILNTFAHIIQFPFQKNGKLIAFASPDEGTGKDTLLLIIMKVLGRHCTAHYTSTDQFWDKHDTIIMGKPFVYLEEACSKQNKANEGRLKARATAEDLSINPKGQSPINIPNIGRHFMTTNEVQPFMTSQTDRRGLIIKPSTRLMKQDWNAFYKMIETDWFIKAIGTYLQQIDLTNWDINKDMPTTELKKELQELTRSSEQIFLEQWNANDWVSSSTLYQNYREYCIEHSLSHAQNAKSFGIKIIHFKQYYKVHLTSRKIKYYAPIGLAKEFEETN